MQKFKVIALSVGGKLNKVFKSGDIVSANDFAAPIQSFIDGGFLLPIESETDQLDMNIDVDADVDHADVKAEIEGKTYKSFSKDQLIEKLVDCGFSFDPTSSKSILFKSLSDQLNG